MKNEGNTRKSISQIQVSRQKYIPVSKSQLHDSLLSFLRHPTDNEDGGGSGSADDDAIVSQFLLLSSCLDSILHAEHKSVLEKMRADYFSNQSGSYEEDLDTIGNEREREAESAGGIKFVDDQGNGSVKRSGDDTAEVEENQMPFLKRLDLMQIFGNSMGDIQKNDDDKNSSTSEVATATRFQRSFMKLLQDAQFEELSVRDLMLTSALNSDYLLTLPIYVDWKRASKSNAIIFRRGYCTEKQKGLLIVEKLDYLQSKVLQGISKPLVTVGLWIKEAIQQASENEGIRLWISRIQLRVQDFQQPYTSNTTISDDFPKSEQDLDKDLPIWLAAQEAVSRYEGFLSSIGPRSRLLRKFLTLVGVLPPSPEVPFEFESENNVATEPHLRRVFHSGRSYYLESLSMIYGDLLQENIVGTMYGEC